jgi:endo-1,4-beta-xylanase
LLLLNSVFASDAKYKDLVLKNFNQITAEFEMKMESLWGSTSYNWAGADNIVNFAQDNKLEVHGHTLIWYNSFQPGLKHTTKNSI